MRRSVSENDMIHFLCSQQRSRMSRHIHWFFKRSDGQWAAYSIEDSETIESAFSQRILEQPLKVSCAFSEALFVAVLLSFPFESIVCE